MSAVKIRQGMVRSCGLLTDGQLPSAACALGCFSLLLVSNSSQGRGARQSLIPPLQKPVGDSLHKFSLGSFILNGKLGSQLSRAEIESVCEVFVCLATGTSINGGEREPNQQIATALK